MEEKYYKRAKLFAEWIDRIISGDLPVAREWVGNRIFFHFEDGQQINFTKEEFSIIIPQIEEFLGGFDSLLDSE